MTRLPYLLVAAGLLALAVVAVAPSTPLLHDVFAPDHGYYRAQLLAVGVLCLGVGSVSVVWRSASL